MSSCRGSFPFTRGGDMSRLPLTVGIIANPASGRDVRRLTANAGLFSSTDKVSVISTTAGGFWCYRCRAGADAHRHDRHCRSGAEEQS